MKRIFSILFFIIIILTPVLFITTGMRIALSPLFFNVEYRLPNFPADSYGFSLEDRLKWADFSIAYIAGKVSDQKFMDAELDDGSSLFNNREISHMIDVRDLTVIMLWVWRALIVLFAGAFIYCFKNSMYTDFLSALNKGARVTIALIAAVLLFLIVNFNQLFTLFHQIFFEGDTWLFYYSDSLIRLFPIKFWQDLFIFIGAISLVFCALVLYLHYRHTRSAA